MLGWEDLDAEEPPPLYLSYAHFEKAPLRRDQESWSEGVIDTILKIGSLGIVSYAVVRTTREEFIANGRNIFSRMKEQDETRYFKTYAGITKHLEYTTEISKERFDRETASELFRMTDEEIAQEIEPLRKEFDYAGNTLLKTLHVEARIKSVWNVQALAYTASILAAKVYL